MTIDPETLVDSRIQLHWAVQTLSSAADKMLDKAADDSHSNLGWDSQLKQIVGRVGAAIDVLNFKLIFEDDSLDLAGQTLERAMDWLGKKLKVELAQREYDMPDHRVANGAQFNPDDEHLASIADWYVFGQAALAKQGDLRIWPHHFDLGFFKPNVVEDNGIGGGFSVGDDHYPFPYIYINPYGIERPVSLPALGFGFWTDIWFGAVMTADELSVENGLDAAREFAKDSVAKCSQLMSSK